MNAKTLSAGLLIFAALGVGGCSRTDDDWEKAKASNTAAAYADYLAKHPQTVYAEEARAAIEVLDWNAALSAKTIDAYNAYLAKYPQGRFAGDAINNIDHLQWANVATTPGGEIVDSDKEPGKALDLLTGIINNTSAPPARRALAVDFLGRRLLGVTQSVVATDKRIVAGIYTFGLSELAVAFMGRKPIIPDDQLPKVGDLLIDLLDDPSDEVRNAAVGVVQASSTWISPVLLKACDGKPGARRIAIPQLTRDLAERIKFFHDDPSITIDETTTFLKCLDRAAGDADPEISRIGKGNLAALQTVFSDWATALAKTSDAQTLSTNSKLAAAPGFGAALVAAIPSFRERLSDADPNIRLAAAHMVAVVQGGGYLNSAALAIDLWAKPINYKPTDEQSKDLDALISKLKSTHAADFFAQIQIQRLGPIAAPAAPLLAEIISAADPDKNTDDLVKTIDSMIWIGPPAASSAPALVPLLKAHSPQVQRAAAIALAYISADPLAAPVLKSVVTGESSADQNNAAIALLLLDPNDPAALKLLELPTDGKVNLITLFTTEDIRDHYYRTERMRPAIQSLLLLRGH